MATATATAVTTAATATATAAAAAAADAATATAAGAASEAVAEVVLPPDDPRAVHIRRVLRKDVPGSTLLAGILGGPLCTATVTAVAPAVGKRERRAAAAAATAAAAGPAADTDGAAGTAGTTAGLSPPGTLKLALSALHPPPPPRVDLLLAHPRPKVLARLLPGLATAGVGRVVVANAYRVERCYWDSRVLADVAAPLVEGLCQGGVDTRLPVVTAARRLGVWVEDELGPPGGGELRVVAHPGGVRLADALDAHLDAVAGAAGAAAVSDATAAPEAAADAAADAAAAAAAVSVRVLVAIGPEGGWMPRELSLLAAAGFVAVRLGGRILRSDAAAVAAVVLAHDALEGVAGRHAPREGESTGRGGLPPVGAGG